MHENLLDTDIALFDLPAQPDDVPWPTRTWPTATPEPTQVDVAALDQLVARPFGEHPPEDLGLTRALLVVHQGRLLVERYGPGFHSDFDILAGREPEADGPDTLLTSWSMAKSMLHCAIGIAARSHGLQPTGQIPVPEWSDPADPRHNITWEQLLAMSSGLAWVEEYLPDAGSDVIDMLFGEGHTDMAAFAASFPLASTPGTQFVYSSGTTNILARALQQELGLKGNRKGMEAWLRTELFDPLGMTSARPDFDEAGTWSASSYVWATARDFARFGLLYLRGGTWGKQPVIERPWVDNARTPIALDTNHACRYGAHWWVHDDGLATFSCHGYEGQRITCVPTKDLVVVRLGKTPSSETAADTDPDPIDVYIDKIIGCFADV